MVAKFSAANCGANAKFVSATKQVRPLLNQKRHGHFLEYLLRGFRVRDVVPRRTAEKSLNSGRRTR
jgi:hypothetical protein